LQISGAFGYPNPCALISSVPHYQRVGIARRHLATQSLAKGGGVVHCSWAGIRFSKVIASPESFASTQHEQVPSPPFS
jgi:hypothetical protein